MWPRNCCFRVTRVPNDRSRDRMITWSLADCSRNLDRRRSWVARSTGTECIERLITWSWSCFYNVGAKFAQGGSPVSIRLCYRNLSQLGLAAFLFILPEFSLIHAAVAFFSFFIKINPAVPISSNFDDYLLTSMVIFWQYLWLISLNSTLRIFMLARRTWEGAIPNQLPKNSHLIKHALANSKCQSEILWMTINARSSPAWYCLECVAVVNNSSEKCVM